MALASIPEAVAAIARGEMVVVVDDADRENEGDLVMAAEAADAEKIAFFLAHTSGVICAPITPERADELELPLMVSNNTESQRTAFTVSVDAAKGTTTGISAARPGGDDRRADRPGHPARGSAPARPHLPAAVPDRRGAQARRPHRGRRRPRPLAGLTPAGVLCEVVTEDKAVDGSAARARGVRGAPPVAHHQHRRPDPLPAPERDAGQAGGPGPDPDRGRGLHRLRLRVAARRRAAPGLRARRGGRPSPTSWSGCTRSA